MAILLGGPAAADRHCAPALERYYAARHAILTPDTAAGESCETRVTEAIGRLADAARAARDCGCEVLEVRLQEVIDRAGSEAPCRLRADEVLGSANSLERLAEACH